MSSPGLSSISVTHRPHYWGCSQTGWAADGKGLQDMYMVSAAWTKTCKSDQKKKKKWSSGCGQANVFSMFLKIEVNTVQDCSCTSCGRGCEALWVGWSLGKRLNWFGHWELKAVHLNMKDMIIQWPSGLPVSSDWINRRNLKTHTRRFGNWVRREAKVWEWARDQESSSF